MLLKAATIRTPMNFFNSYTLSELMWTLQVELIKFVQKQPLFQTKKKQRSYQFISKESFWRKAKTPQPPLLKPSLISFSIPTKSRFFLSTFVSLWLSPLFTISLWSAWQCWKLRNIIQSTFRDIKWKAKALASEKGDEERGRKEKASALISLF